MDKNTLNQFYSFTNDVLLIAYREADKALGTILGNKEATNRLNIYEKKINYNNTNHVQKSKIISDKISIKYINGKFQLYSGDFRVLDSVEDTPQIIAEKKLLKKIESERINKINQKLLITNLSSTINTDINQLFIAFFGKANENLNSIVFSKRDGAVQCSQFETKKRIQSLTDTKINFHDTPNSLIKHVEINALLCMEKYDLTKNLDNIIGMVALNYSSLDTLDVANLDVVNSLNKKSNIIN